MIKKINIGSFGQYQDYKWGQGDKLSEKVLQKLNIIYGRNYSGKTTLSRIFSCVEQGALVERYEDAAFSLEMFDGTSISNEELTTPYKFRVYNSDFIKSHLRFFINEEEAIEPFTLIGATNVELQKQIDEVEQVLGADDTSSGKRGELKVLTVKLAASQKQKEEFEEQLTAALTKEANKKIKTNPYYWGQNAGTYNRTRLEREIESILQTPSLNLEVGPELETELKQKIDELEKPAIALLAASAPKIPALIETVRELVSRKINVSKMLTSLVEAPELNTWVESGFYLHQGEYQCCKFCGSEISPLRWQELREHFSKEMQELQSEIDTQLAAIEKYKDGLTNFLEARGITASAFYHDMQGEFGRIVDLWEQAKGIYLATISSLEAQLRQRRKNIFDAQDYEEVQDPSVQIINAIRSLNTLIQANNDYTSKLSAEKEKCRKALRYNEIYSFISTIKYQEQKGQIEALDKGILEDKDKEEFLREEVRILEGKRANLMLALNDEGKAAEAINLYLTQFFGSNHLRLEPEAITNSDERKVIFKVKRGGEPAFNLSNGEASLISFCYFVARMKDELSSADASKLIIYIDDPVSSLDANHIYYVYSLIESIICEPCKYAQLFISTHNLEFLKYLKRLTTPVIEDGGKKKALSRLDLCVYREEKPGARSRSVLRPMPQSLSKHITEYDFLFKEIYSVIKPYEGDRYQYIENNYTQFYNLPNYMRKFLECYFSYRRPDISKPLCAETLSELLGDTPWPKMISRIINEGSHLTWAEKGVTLLEDVQEAEKAAKLIFKAIRDKDRVHFEALCKVCDINLEEEGVTLD